MTRRAVITGAGQRVGRAIAVELGRQGFELAVHYRSSEAGAQQTLDEAGGRGFLVQADLATPEGCAGLCEAVSARWSSLQVLVNNASAFSPSNFEGTTAADWDAMQAIHSRAPFLLSRDLLPLLRAGPSAAHGAKPGEAGLVVHMVDIGAVRPVSGYAAYSASKAALLMLVRAMAVELAPAVRTVGISPGQVIWPDDYDDDLRARLARRIPMGRVGEPEDVARLLRFIALEAPYLNGCVVDVDGGLSCRY